MNYLWQANIVHSGFCTFCLSQKVNLQASTGKQIKLI